MDKLEGLRAGIAEMRSVARRLNQWADDMEASFRREEASAGEVESRAGQVAASKEKETAKPADTEPAAVKEARKTLTLPEVRAVLAEKCAAGFSAQVEALIKSYGVVKLRDLPVDRYEELLAAVSQLGGDTDAG